VADRGNRGRRLKTDGKREKEREREREREGERASALSPNFTGCYATNEAHLGGARFSSYHPAPSAELYASNKHRHVCRTNTHTRARARDSMYTLDEEIYGRTRGDSKSSHASIAREKERAHPSSGKNYFHRMCLDPARESFTSKAL